MLSLEMNKFPMLSTTICELPSRVCRLLCRLAGDDLGDCLTGGRREDGMEGGSKQCSAALAVLSLNQIIVLQGWDSTARNCLKSATLS